MSRRTRRSKLQICAEHDGTGGAHVTGSMITAEAYIVICFVRIMVVIHVPAQYRLHGNRELSWHIVYVYNIR